MTANWQEYLEDELEKIAALSNQVAEEKIALEEGENRMVAIFFLDIRGFTAMSEKLHSEQLKRIIDKVFIVFSNVITKFGGFVNQYEGDKIMAFFGSKVKTETDTERAIKSALEILEKRTQVNALFAKQNIELEVRIGINTGMVTTGKVGLKRERDFTVYGDAVNVASRLESNAPINQILITKRTMKLVEDKFDFLFHQKLNVKGKSEPLETYTVLQQKKQKIERWERKSLILKSEYVGRENEVSKMENLFIAASASDQEKEYRSWMIGLRGDAGIGKSRLTHEFTKKILQQANVDDAGKMMLFGYTNSYAQAPFFIWISLLKKYFDISETDDAETIKSKFEFGCLTLTRELSHTEHKNFYNIRKMLALLCGIHENSEEIWEPKQLQLSIQLAIRYFLEAAAKIANKRNLPLIIVLEDLHWLDEASLQMFKTLLQTLNSEEKHDGRPAKKIFFILTYRQDYNLFNDVLLHTIFEEISLQPLSQHNFFKMVSSMLGDISLPDELVEKLLYQSAGNPFYIEEWVHWLIEQERIIKQDNQWMIQQPENEIPESLHSLILSRIDSLSTKQKQILQTASVIGQLFHSSVLRHVNEKILSIDNLDEELSHLT
jgi:class 3 adenylate cyclase